MPIEAHLSIGILEHYHHISCRAYEIMVNDLKGSEINKEMILKIAVKAVNNFSRPDGLVPAILVFRTHPKMS